MAKEQKNIVNKNETDTDQDILKLLEKKLQKTLNFGKAFSAIEQNMNGKTTDIFNEGFLKKEYDYQETIKKDPVKVFEINRPKAERLNNKGDKKIYIMLGLAFILGPYAMGIGLAFAAPLGAALIALPFVITGISKIVCAFAKLKANKLFKEINTMKEDINISRKNFEANNDLINEKQGEKQIDATQIENKQEEKEQEKQTEKTEEQTEKTEEKQEEQDNKTEKVEEKQEEQDNKTEKTEEKQEENQENTNKKRTKKTKTSKVEKLEQEELVKTIE